MDTQDIFKEFLLKYNLSLNEQQCTAVQSIDGATLLLAVPGSGKTTTLVSRLGYMILCKKISPKNILSITYTRSATADMRDRFINIFGNDTDCIPEFRTINGIAEMIIRTYEKKSANPPFKLLSNENDRIAIIRAIIKSLNDEYPTDSEIIEVDTAITYIKNMMLTSDEISNLTAPDNISQIYNSYIKTLRERKLMDYDDQLVYARMILMKDPEILNHFQDLFKYICVDEAQDTSKLQHFIIALLAKKHNNIFMVGDDDQSIYGFRAAYPQALTEFENTYPSPKILFMETNYRSSPEISSKASDFVNANLNHHRKNMITPRGNGVPVINIPQKNRTVQYEFLLKLAQSTPFDTAVLYRDSESAIPLIDLLLRQDIPFRLLRSNTTFFTNKTILDVKAFLRLALNGRDYDAFMRIYHKYRGGFDKKSAEYAYNRAKREHSTILNALSKNAENFEKIKSKVKKLTELMNTVANSTTLWALNAIGDVYGDNLNDSGHGAETFEILKILSLQEPSVKSFLERLDVLQKLMTYEKKLSSSDGIILSTIHSAKGLEFDSVYIIDVFDGMIPKVDPKTATTSDEDMDMYQEERRLFYVAMTRAKNKLRILNIVDKPSCFVKELFSKSPIARTTYQTNKKSKQIDYPEPIPGMKLRHVREGIVTVNSVTKQSGMTMIRVTNNSNESSTKAWEILWKNNMIEIID